MKLKFQIMEWIEDIYRTIGLIWLSLFLIVVCLVLIVGDRVYCVKVIEDIDVSTCGTMTTFGDCYPPQFISHEEWKLTACDGFVYTLFVPDPKHPPDIRVGDSYRASWDSPERKATDE